MIHVLFTGGTISMRHDAARGGNIPRHGGADLVALAGIPSGVPYLVEDWAQMPACHLDATRLWALRNRVAAIAASGEAQGILITHGTYVLEETAYLLGRTIAAQVPIVLTGAMRTADHPQWDGGRNLRDAMRVAADAGSRGHGVMVVFAGQVFDGMEAVKMHANDPEAFAAPHGAPVGDVTPDGVRFAGAARARRTLAPAALDRRVLEVPVVVGDDGSLLDAAQELGDGVVVVGFGSGNIPPGAVPAVERWVRAGKSVVLASRCAYGVVEPLYAFDGGGAGLVRAGAIPAGPRSPAQARMELLISLSAGVAYGAAA